jgi:hypothetical protein
MSEGGSSVSSSEVFSMRSVVLAALLSISACSNPGEAAKASAEPSAKASSAHAPAGAKPGSHEDWCGEHGVPESQCTRCNPKLIPAFKATKDWCEEHDLPESQCTKCNPDLKIVRPPKGT